MAAAARPRFLSGPSGGATLVFPMATVTNLSLSSVTQVRQRGSLNPLPLLHQEDVWLDDRTPAADQEIELTLAINKSRLGDALAAQELLWDTIGTSKAHLWFVDDDTYDVVTTTSAPTAGAGRVITYTGPAATWFATGDYLFLPSAGGGSQNEIVVVTAKTDATPSFTATLAYPHSSGIVVYRVAMVYPNAVLAAVRPTEPTPLGKGKLTLTFRAQSKPLTGTTLPS